MPTICQAINEAGATTEPGAPDHIWAKINMKDIHMGGSAQTTAALNVTFKPITGLRIGSGYHHAPRHEPWPLACGRVFPKKKQPSSAEITEPSSTPSLAWLSMASPLAPRPA